VYGGRMMERIQVVGFDADDTLWVNEPYFQAATAEFCRMMDMYGAPEDIGAELFRTEMGNLSQYGYGAKGFTLSLVETAIRVSQGKVSAGMIEAIIGMGKALLGKPVELLDGVRGVLEELQPRYRLIVATKGDLLDQERKMERSGLARYFHHIEIMSDKSTQDYRKLLGHLDVEPGEFLMVGNSLKSDILPVVELGGFAVHVPFHTTWQHEEVEAGARNQRMFTVKTIDEVLGILE